MTHQTRAAHRSAAQWPPMRWATIGRITAPVGIMGGSLWLLAQMIDLPLLATLPETIAALPLGRCLLAACFCALSLWAVAGYDGLAHRHFRTGIDTGRARKSGFATIAIAQTAGFGVLTGAAVRWRMLPQLGLASAMQLSVFVSVTFMSALAFLGGLACLVLPAPGWTTLPAVLAALGLPLVFVMLTFAPCVAPLRHRMPLPSLRALRALLAWSGLDLKAAALALYVLIPAPELSFASFLPIFLLALGAAMLSGAPGGVGPFELTLITLLPQGATADLITAIVVFRGLYYAAPAIGAVALVFMTKAPATPKLAIPKPDANPATKPAYQSGSPIAEHGVLAQNAGSLRHHPAGSYALWHTDQTATLLFDPVAGAVGPALADLRRQADRNSRTACLYKCSAWTALAARRQGWAVARVAQDCSLPLATYDLASPGGRGLRRKLRKAAQSGVTVQRAGRLPSEAMRQIDAAWQAATGPARGGTMGRFCPDYLGQQDVYLAHLNGDLIAFASFHSDPAAPCLDLMRHAPKAPDGTMHLIVQPAIDSAQTDGKTSLSLAALPYLPAWTQRTGSLRRRCDNPGLRQFKASFAPDLQSRYAAAPSRMALVIALADITCEVHRPRPLPAYGHPHKQHEDYEVALHAHP